MNTYKLGIGLTVGVAFLFSLNAFVGVSQIKKELNIASPATAINNSQGAFDSLETPPAEDTAEVENQANLLNVSNAGSDNSFRATGKFYCPQKANVPELAESLAGYFGKTKKTITDHWGDFSDQFALEQNISGFFLAYKRLNAVCNDPSLPRGLRLTEISPSSISPKQELYLEGFGFHKNVVSYFKLDNVRAGTTFRIDSTTMRISMPTCTPGKHKVSVESYWGSTNDLSITCLGLKTTPTPTPKLTPTPSKTPTLSRGPMPSIPCDPGRCPTGSPLVIINSPTCPGLSQNACTVNKNPICEWWNNACQLPSCGAIIRSLGYNNTAKYDVGCFPNGKPDASWSFAGPTNDCGSVKDATKVGCFWRAN